MFKHRNGSSISNILGIMIGRYMASMGMMLYAVDLTDPEVKAAIKEAVETAVDGLETKKNELLAEVKKLRKGAEIKPEDVERIEAERDDFKSKFELAQKDVKKLTTERDTAVTNLAKESELSANAHKERDLTESLAALNVSNPIALKAAKALLSPQAQVVIEGDKRVTKVGDKLLLDHLKDVWAATDEGKHFIQADHNSGGGAGGGGNGGGGGKTGNFGGSKEERQAAIAAKFPNLNKT